MTARRLSYVAAIAVSFSLTACGTVHAPIGAADPTNPECANIIVSLPDRVLGLERTETTSQSTAAWGHGDSAIILRCGVTPPPPTTDLCTTIESRTGTTIDWIVKEQSQSQTVLMTTYGREPAIDISIPRKVAPDQPSAAAIEVSGLVSKIPQKSRCLAATDVQ